MSVKTIEHAITLSNAEMMAVFGRDDAAIRELEERLDVHIVSRGNQIKIIGPPEETHDAARVIDTWLEAARHSAEGKIKPQQIQYAIDAVRRKEDKDLKEAYGDRIEVPYKGRRISPMTLGQKRYVDAIRKKDVVFGIGPAGTGKTYLAMAMAVNRLVAGTVSRIVLVRPVVEAGESLGFLPGDIAQKIDPYLRPLYDALYEMMGVERSRTLLDTGVVEVAPLAYMRGRTLNNAFIVLDEAQNTTIEQMKMFLTRMGFDSKIVVTGDITQIDLPKHKESGLIHVGRVLRGIPQIAFIEMDESDVVRHSLVQAIVRAYEQAANPEKDKRTEKRREEAAGATEKGEADSVDASQ